MPIRRPYTTAIALLSWLAWVPTASAQTAPEASTPAFDLADVHASAHSTTQYMRGGVLRGGRYDVRNASVVDLIGLAYGVDNSKVQGGPAWLDSDRFDIAAKAPAATPADTVKLMLRALLADRFQLKLHNGSKEMPVQILSVGKGKPKMKASVGDESRCQGKPQDPPPPPGVPGYNILDCRSRTMQQLADDLPNWAGNYISTQVADKTGLTGTFDFELKWTGRGQLVRAGADGISIFDALDKQLGLKLEPGKAAIDVVFVDNANRPSPNAPGVEAKLPPPPPAEFEVATIKPSRPDATNINGNLNRDRLELTNFPLKLLIREAWSFNSDDLVAGAPKFADTVHYDIMAKAPPPPPGLDVNEDDLRLMLRALLVDRFALKTHWEERPVEGYVLTSVKPKLTKADPTNRTGCKEGPGADGKDPRIANPILSRLLSCQNMTMAQFVALLPTLANGYAHVDVLDESGLTDPYDFTLSFSAIGLVQQQPTGRPGEPGTDPSGAISLPEAINKQLGLKLELKKRPMQVLVIDHLDEKPSEN